MAADNYRETAAALAEKDGGLDEFSYDPKSGRIEFETSEREFYMSPGEIGVKGDEEFTYEDLQLDEVQEALEGIEELQMYADAIDYVEEAVGEEVATFNGDELEPSQGVPEEVDGSVAMDTSSNEFDYSALNNAAS
jgi:hypothetical protein